MEPEPTQELEHIESLALAFCCILHQRMGSASMWRELDDRVVIMIVEGLKCDAVVNYILRSHLSCMSVYLPRKDLRRKVAQILSAKGDHALLRGRIVSQEEAAMSSSAEHHGRLIDAVWAFRTGMQARVESMYPQEIQDHEQTVFMELAESCRVFAEEDMQEDSEYGKRSISLHLKEVLHSMIHEDYDVDIELDDHMQNLSVYMQLAMEVKDESHRNDLMARLISEALVMQAAYFPIMDGPAKIGCSYLDPCCNCERTSQDDGFTDLSFSFCHEFEADLKQHRSRGETYYSVKIAVPCKRGSLVKLTFCGPIFSTADQRCECQWCETFAARHSF